MSKALLVLNQLPFNCKYCEFKGVHKNKEKKITETFCMVPEYPVINVTDYTANIKSRPSFCPLKPMLEKENAIYDTDNDYVKGWNQCIDVLNEKRCQMCCRTCIFYNKKDILSDEYICLETNKSVNEYDYCSSWEGNQ